MPEAASEVLTMEQQANEYIMLQLRMRKGLDLSAFRLRFGSPLYDQLQQNAVHSIQTGQLVHSGNILCISKPSLMLADGIIAGLFWKIRAYLAERPAYKFPENHTVPDRIQAGFLPA